MFPTAPSLRRGHRDRDVRSTRACFLPISKIFHSIVFNSLYLMFSERRSQSTVSAPLDSCTCPHTTNRGLTRHRACLRASQPAEPRLGASSQWNLGGVCEITTSQSKGTCSQRATASSGV